MEPKSSQPQAFYRWVDAEGRLHVVSSLDAVPANQRAQVERVTLTAHSAPPQALGLSASNWRLDPASFGIGFGVSLVLSLLLRLLPQGWRSLTKVAVVLGAAALLTGLYLGAVRRAAGNSDASALATPSALIQDARNAVEQMNQRQKQQEEELRKLQAEGR
jgi:hypothetical protein